MEKHHLLICVIEEPVAARRPRTPSLPPRVPLHSNCPPRGDAAVASPSAAVLQAEAGWPWGPTGSSTSVLWPASPLSEQLLSRQSDCGCRITPFHSPAPYVSRAAVKAGSRLGISSLPSPHGGLGSYLPQTICQPCMLACNHALTDSSFGATSLGKGFAAWCGLKPLGPHCCAGAGPL